MKGIGKGEEEGGGIEGGGREKSSNCTLSFRAAKNFIPGKALFFLSLSGKFCKHSPHRSCRSHTATFTQPYVKTDAVFCRAQLAPPPSIPPLPSLRPHPARCCPPWASPDSKHSLPWSRLEQTKSAAQGWPGSSLRGSSLAQNAWQWTRPNTHRLQTSLYPLFFFPPSLFIDLTSCSYLISTRFVLPSLLPLERSCPTV